jgi:hypothetical protein
MASSRSFTLLVKLCEMRTRLSKSITWPRSCARRCFTKPTAGFLRRLNLVFHARARVEQYRQRYRQVRSVEELDLLRLAVFVDVEGFLREVRDEVARAIHSGDVEGDDFDARLERRLLRVAMRHGEGRDRRNRGEPDRRAHSHRQRPFIAPACRAR